MKAILKEIREFWVLASTFFVVVEAPLRIVYHYDPEGWLFIAEVIVSLTFISDLFFNLKIAGLFQKNRDPAKLKEYLKGWFWIDLLTAIPYDLILYGLHSNLQSIRAIYVVRYVRLIRVGKLLHSIFEVQHSTVSRLIMPGVLRLMLFGIWAMLGTHWITCGWIALSGRQSIAAWADSYLNALYWTVTTLSTVGYGDITPENNSQKAFAMLVMMLGVSSYTFVIGNVASVLSSLDFARSRLQERQERLIRFLRKRKVPPKIEQRIHDYFSYLLDHEMGYDEKQLLSGLPEALRKEISVYLHYDILKTVPFLSNASEDLIQELVHRLEPQVFTPGSFVVHQSQKGSSMYFINKGTVEITSRDGKNVYAELKSGQYFGEMALLLHQPRTASVRAVDYCELYELKRGPFRLVIDRYPEFRQEIENMVEERQARVARRKSK